MVIKFKNRVGSRSQVIHGTAKMTTGGLTKRQLKYNKRGRIVSRKVSRLAKKNNRLVKAGYITRKGVFGSIKIGGMNVLSEDPSPSALVDPSPSPLVGPSPFTLVGPSPPLHLWTRAPLHLLEKMKVSQICFMYIGKHSDSWDEQLKKTINEWLSVIDEEETQITIIYHLDKNMVFRCQSFFEGRNVIFYNLNKEFIINKLKLQKNIIERTGKRNRTEKQKNTIQKYTVNLIKMFDEYLEILKENNVRWISYAIRVKDLISILYTGFNEGTLYFDITTYPVKSVNYIDKFKLQSIPKRLMGDFIFPEYMADGVLYCDLFAMLSVRTKDFGNKHQFLILLTELTFKTFKYRYYDETKPVEIFTLIGDFLMRINKTYLKTHGVILDKTTRKNLYNIIRNEIDILIYNEIRLPYTPKKKSIHEHILKILKEVQEKNSRFFKGEMSLCINYINPENEPKNVLNKCPHQSYKCFGSGHFMSFCKRSLKTYKR